MYQKKIQLVGLKRFNLTDEPTYDSTVFFGIMGKQCGPRSDCSYWSTLFVEKASKTFQQMTKTE